MHAALTRAAGQHRGRRLKTAALFILAVCLALAFSGPLYAAQEPTLSSADVTSSIKPFGTDHELHIEVTRPGSESLTLGARLKADGGLIQRPIAWTIRHSLAGATGDIVWHGEEPVAELPLEPGDYVVEAAYGTAKVYQPVSVTPGQRLAMTFILNVGGIRPLSRIEAVGYPSAMPATHAIFAVSGPNAGREVARDIKQGEIVRVVAGRYRVESRFIDGNTVTDAEVTVKPGILTSIEISHLAAFAQVSIPVSAGSEAHWRIRQASGTWQRSGHGNDFALVLAPGSYEVNADVAGHTLSASFTLKASETRHVTLGQ